ncbi:MAG: CopD family protein [Azoarcus sp.]|nr:CopD family protein [Azoarcus sp.]MDD2874454.1 CopD family protein [Azoarcus sp.]MDX9838781.1 CopD family protein [Azoarcus sp.]
MTSHHLMLFLHVCGVVVWVGGMAFAWFCLRPAAMQLPPDRRLGLWAGVFRSFFPMVWVSIALILVSGVGMLIETGFTRAPVAWHVMLLTGLVMIGVFASIWFGPWRTMQRAVDAEDWARAAVAMNTIRQRVGFNLGLGLLTTGIATLGLGI